MSRSNSPEFSAEAERIAHARRQRGKRWPIEKPPRRAAKQATLSLGVPVAIEIIQMADMPRFHYDVWCRYDDFTASGTSILPDPDVVGGLKGKLVKFLKSVKQANDTMGGDQAFSQGYEIYVHHYTATEEARRRIAGVYEKIQSDLASHFGAHNIQFTFGMLLPDGIAITEGSSDPFAALCQRYYDDAIEGKGTHSGQSGITGKVYGYANCGLPVVLEHNTPNNSLSLLHARTDSNSGKHNMRPLFHRRERHSDLEQAVIPNESGAPNE